MFAVVIMQPGVFADYAALLFFLALIGYVGLCVVLRVRTKALRILGAIAIAALMARTAIAAAPDAVMVNECAPYTASDWQWWAIGCWMLPSA